MPITTTMKKNLKPIVHMPYTPENKFRTKEEFKAWRRKLKEKQAAMEAAGKDFEKDYAEKQAVKESEKKAKKTKVAYGVMKEGKDEPLKVFKTEKAAENFIAKQQPKVQPTLSVKAL